MLRYAMAATALRLFSISPQTKGIYRRLGSVVGGKRRVALGVPNHYINRARHLLDTIRRYDALRDGDRILEVGTGWLHWESIIIRLFYDVEAVLFDVWDSRQLESLRLYCSQLAGRIDAEFETTADQRDRAHSLLQAISTAGSFDEIYQLLGFRYVTDPSGTLHQFESQSFRAVVSGSVLQHVKRNILPGYILDFQRLLQPGGYSIHMIDLGDQISYYDPSVSIKNYLRYSDFVWKVCFQGDIQYFNRVQRPEWLELFERAGLVLVEEEFRTVDLDNLKVNKKYRYLARSDLECTILYLAHAKPPVARLS